jgi:FAD:protein FMN transferase
MRGCVPALVATVMAAWSAAAEPLTFSGPAMGTTYRVTLAAPLAGMAVGTMHRDVERLLARIDRAASTWRQDSDARRFNQAAAGEWVEIGPDLAALLAVARRVHEASNGAFDVTAGPLVRHWREAQPPATGQTTSQVSGRFSHRLAAIRTRVGMPLVELRPAAQDRPAAIRKRVDGVELDLAGIGPGFAVDRIGERLVDVGSASHLVELGGEVRAWGDRGHGNPWRVRVGASAEGGRVIELSAGKALATASIDAGRMIVDPRTGQGIAGPARSLTVVAETCGEADAWAVAAIVLDLHPDEDGLVRVPPAPSTTADPPAARPAAP